MRVAWFGAVPPLPSESALHSAEVLPSVAKFHEVDVYISEDAPSPLAIQHVASIRRSGEFLYTQLRRPYELIVYQLAADRYHEFCWGYATRFPGLVVLHQLEFHKNRALQLVEHGRLQDYRSELLYDQPQLLSKLTRLSNRGLDNRLYDLFKHREDWPFIRSIVSTARLIAVHNKYLAEELHELYPEIQCQVLRNNVSAPTTETVPDDSRAHPSVVFSVFGCLSSENRTPAILQAFSNLIDDVEAELRLVGEQVADYDVMENIDRLGLRTRVKLVRPSSAAILSDELARADVCFCLQSLFGSRMFSVFLRAMAAGKPTVISGLSRLTDVPACDSYSWTTLGNDDAEAVAVWIDLLDEEASLVSAMQRLAQDKDLRLSMGEKARAYWERQHSGGAAVSDYGAAFRRALSLSLPMELVNLPEHFRSNGTKQGMDVSRQFDISIDVLS